MRVIAIIPARGGSKGVPGKNCFPIEGKPLIEYSIEAALASQYLSDIFVSSDDPKIITIASKFTGVKIHRRDKTIAGDSSPVSQTIEAVLIENKLFDVDAIMLLQPTSPIRTGMQIDAAIELMERTPEANSLISVCAMNDVHPARMYWKQGNELDPILKQFEETRRQDIPPAYFRNGSIYLTRLEAFLKHKTVMIKPSIGFEMPSSHLLNIDEPRDLLIAEPLIRAWKKGEL